MIDFAESYPIILPEKINSYVFYDKILSKIIKALDSQQKNICLVFRNTRHITTHVLPLLLGVGLIADQNYKNKISLDIGYNLDLNRFLRGSKFLEFAQGVFDFNKEELPAVAKMANEHKITVLPIKEDLPNDFYSIPTEQKDQIIAYEKSFLKTDKIPLILRNLSSNPKQAKAYLAILVEIISNTRIHSRSGCMIFGQTGNFSLSICINDFGIGFDQSLKLQGYNVDLPINILGEMKRHNITNKDSFLELLHIFRALEYSRINKEKTKRYNLFDLKNEFNKNRATIRIHSESAQIVFSGDRCYGCNKHCESLFECYYCLMDDYKKEQEYSPVRLYDESLQGVHIEAELPI